MTISFTCPHCGKSMQVDDHFAGQQGPCSGCGKPIAIPGTAPAARRGGTGIFIGLLAAGLIASVCIIGILLALLLPAVQAAREAARRSVTSNNMKQIGLALHNYHDMYQSLPPAFVADAQGKPLYSWRVLILPYLERDDLAKQFDYSKPWDAPENIAISSADLEVFRSPSDANVAPSGTNFFVLIDPEGMFTGGTPERFSSVSDGLSNTIMVVETKGIRGSWAAPIDPRLSSVKMKIGANPGEIQPVHPGGTQVLLGDGSVTFLSQDVDSKTLGLMFTRRDGQVIMLP